MSTPTSRDLALLMQASAISDMTSSARAAQLRQIAAEKQAQLRAQYTARHGSPPPPDDPAHTLRLLQPSAGAGTAAVAAAHGLDIETLRTAEQVLRNVEQAKAAQTSPQHDTAKSTDSEVEDMVLPGQSDELTARRAEARRTAPAVNFDALQPRSSADSSDDELMSYVPSAPGVAAGAPALEFSSSQS